MKLSNKTYWKNRASNEYKYLVDQIYNKKEITLTELTNLFQSMGFKYIYILDPTCRECDIAHNEVEQYVKTETTKPSNRTIMNSNTESIYTSQPTNSFLGNNQNTINKNSNSFVQPLQECINGICKIFPSKSKVDGGTTKKRKRKVFKKRRTNNKKRKTLVNELELAGNEGFNPKDYNIDKLAKYEKNISTLTENELIDYDLLLTRSFQKYINHLTTGKLNPKNLYTDWALTENKIDVNKLLKSSLTTDSLTINLEKSKPNHVVYKRLKKALILIDKFPNDTIKRIEFKQKIVLNDTNKSLISIKRKLIYWKDLANIASLKPIYDKITFEGIRTFQKRHGIIADGIIGQGTIDALNYSKIQRKQQIIVNLERWKWYQKDLGDQYVIVNIPEFKLNLVKSYLPIPTI
jgi:murein L,D-transpeptidase YcbB/YkuD